MGGNRPTTQATPVAAPVEVKKAEPEAESAITARKRRAEDRASSSSTEDGATKKLLGA
jgi:hypothetical protein